MSKRLEKKLPNKLSDLIAVALRDLAKAERSEKYRIDMGFWHDPDDFYSDDSFCAVCFAGSVMAFSLGAKPDQMARPTHFLQEDKLLALNDVRAGDVVSALMELHVPEVRRERAFAKGSLKPNYRVAQYSDRRRVSRVRFKAQMKRIARDLRAAGL